MAAITLMLRFWLMVSNGFEDSIYRLDFQYVMHFIYIKKTALKKLIP